MLQCKTVIRRHRAGQSLGVLQLVLLKTTFHTKYQIELQKLFTNRSTKYILLTFAAIKMANKYITRSSSEETRKDNQAAIFE